MARYTSEDLRKIRELRAEERAESDREGAEWDAAGAGFTQSETRWCIQYKRAGREGWIVSSPFYDPLRVDPGETRDRDEADRVAQKILTGQWSPNKQGDPEQDITKVRVVRREAAATIEAEFVKSRSADVPRETPEEN